jgi:hypothetical protein
MSVFRKREMSGSMVFFKAAPRSPHKPLELVQRSPELRVQRIASQLFGKRLQAAF